MWPARMHVEPRLADRTDSKFTLHSIIVSSLPRPAFSLGPTSVPLLDCQPHPSSHFSRHGLPSPASLLIPQGSSLP